MRMTRLAVVALTVLLAVMVPFSAQAGNFEITPFAGYTGGGQFTDSVTDAPYVLVT